jgi:hypothetical protein
MTVYRRLARSKKGMSTIFGGLFFVIIILMGFNVMLWGFIQYDAYNHVITSMSQRDQQAVSENLIPINATYPNGGPLNVIVNNLGGSSVSIAAIYIWNTNTTGQCRPTPCIINPVPASPYFTNGNIPAGAVNFLIRVVGINVKDGNSYRISLATTRGREFNLYFPWRFNSLIINGGPGTNFVTNVGPLAIYFDFKSFNYTQGTSGTCSGVAPNPSCPAFCMPSGTPVLLYLRIANTSTNSSVTLLSQTAIQAQGYGTSASGLVKNAWIEASNTVNPSTNFPYVYPSATDYVLAPSGPNGPTPASFAIVKMGGSGPNLGGSVTFGSTGSTQNLSWITFIGIYYLFQGQPQGETIPFMDFVNNAPNCVQ